MSVLRTIVLINVEILLAMDFVLISSFAVVRTKVPLCKHIHKLQSFILRDVPVSAFHEDSSDVNFFDMEDGIPETEPDDQRPEAFSDFSEANMYSRLQANVAALADHIFKKTIPKHLLPSCDTCHLRYNQKMLHFEFAVLRSSYVNANIKIHCPKRTTSNSAVSASALSEEGKENEN